MSSTTAADHLRAALAELRREEARVAQTIHDVMRALAHLEGPDRIKAPEPSGPSEGPVLRQRPILPLTLDQDFIAELATPTFTSPRHPRQEGGVNGAELGRPIDEPVEERPTIRQAILDVVIDPDRRYSTQEIVEAVEANAGWGRASIRSLLSKLAFDGDLKSHERGWYSLGPRQLKNAEQLDNASENGASELHLDSSDGLGEGSRNEDAGTPGATEVPA